MRLEDWYELTKRDEERRHETFKWKCWRAFLCVLDVLRWAVAIATFAVTAWVILCISD